MKKRILAYRRSVDGLLAREDPATDWETVLKRHLDQIAFFQHERLVHLIVTALVAVLCMLCVGIAFIAKFFFMLLPALLLLVLLVFYIAHYYLLENEVQKMYGQYDRILELSVQSRTVITAETASPQS